MSKKVVVKFLFSFLFVFVCGLFVCTGNMSYAKKTVNKQKVLSEEFHRRNIYLSNSENLTYADYGKKYFHVGDFGFLTFSENVDGKSFPGAPSYIRDQLTICTSCGDPFADYDISYSVADSSILSVNPESHSYKVLKGGETTVILNGRAEVNGEKKVLLAKFTFVVIGDASATYFSKKKITNYIVDNVKSTATVGLEDCPDLKCYTFDYMTSNTNMKIEASLDPMTKTVTITSYKLGKAKVTAILNGSAFDIEIENKGTGINIDNYLMDEGDSFKLKLIDYKGNPKWTSTNKDIKVSKNGVVTGKPGNAIIYANLNTSTGDKAKLGCVVSIVKKGMTEVVNAAKHIGATRTYSQPLRMNPAYYDCSSLVWQAYMKKGFDFGLATYAPTAAEECRYCADRGKALVKWTWDDIQNMRFLPGNVVFRVGADNGRYLGIYHVEMFAGYKLNGFDEDGKPKLSMCWANRPDNYYDPCDDVMVDPL